MLSRKNKIIFSIILMLCFTAINLKAQIIEITFFDEVDLENPPQDLKNSSFYLSGKNRNVIRTGKYSKGKKDGTFLYFQEGGGLSKEENYKNGKKDGIFLYFQEGRGLYKEENYKNGKRHGFWKADKGDGYETGYYKNGEKDGQWIIYNNHKTEEFTYKNDIFNGSYVYEDSSNNKIVGEYKNGEKHNSWFHYLDKKLIYTEVFSHGKLISKTLNEF